MAENVLTVSELGAEGDIEKALARVEQDARSKRDAAEVGDTIAEATIQDEKSGTGMATKWKKQSTMVRSGDVELPERTQVFDKNGQPSMVPTASLRYHLSKRHHDGTRKFFAERPADYKEPDYIDQTCEVCVKNSGIRKRFQDEIDYEAHMDSFHPREWQSILRREEREARAGVTTNDFKAALLAMGESEKQALRVLLGVGEEKPKREAKKCPDCNDYYVSKAHKAHAKGA